MAKFKYHSGDIFGKWELVSYMTNGKWKAKCVCGRVYDIFIDHLVKGHSKSCVKCGGKSRAIHNMTRTPEYNSWAKMRDRCTNPNDDRYAQYGGRGVTVCERWDSFENFYSDMGKRPIGCSLDRIDVDGNYEPDNCRWATPKEQMRNRRIHKESILGKATTEVAEDIGIPHGTLRARIKRGWNVDRATTTPVANKSDSVSAKARRLGLKPGTVLTRLSRGWDATRAFSNGDSKCG